MKGLFLWQSDLTTYSRAYFPREKQWRNTPPRVSILEISVTRSSIRTRNRGFFHYFYIVAQTHRLGRFVTKPNKNIESEITSTFSFRVLSIRRANFYQFLLPTWLTSTLSRTFNDARLVAKALNCSSRGIKCS